MAAVNPDASIVLTTSPSAPSKDEWLKIPPDSTLLNFNAMLVKFITIPLLYYFAD